MEGGREISVRPGNLKVIWEEKKGEGEVAKRRSVLLVTRRGRNVMPSNSTFKDLGKL